MKKVILVVLDSVGVGALPDAPDFLDEGANTLAHVAQAAGGLNLPNLEKLGLGNTTKIQGVSPVEHPLACVGKLAERSAAKDTTTGHWELCGVVSDTPFATYPDGYPAEIVDPFEKEIGSEVLCNKARSGTEVIEELGREHVETGKLILYTSADSAFQVAAHEDVVPPEELYDICRVARRILDPFNVARVIARPFIGSPGQYVRTYNRRDFSMPPPSSTLLDFLTEQGVEVVGIGKIHDIFAGRGVSRDIHTEGNVDGLEKMLAVNRTVGEGLIFVNLVDFDMLYGHRRDPKGYARSLEEADSYFGTLIDEMDAETALIITADHGCDPTFSSHTDHTREYVPAMVYSPGLDGGRNIGTRSTYADIAATVAELLGFDFDIDGRPFF